MSKCRGDLKIPNHGMKNLQTFFYQTCMAASRHDR
uniref:Uncharacterized protein n=1 Tax=Rhizophora mucronata TaxID=61149 RepID=A0A2P2N842_RHIMU